MAASYTIVSLALQKLGISGGAKAPRQEDLDLGITTLQSIYRWLISSGLLNRARPVTPTGPYIAGENDRIYRAASTVLTVTLPDQVTDDCGDASTDGPYYDLPGYGSPSRSPRDASFVIINDAVTGNTAEYIYEAYINRWVSVHDLSLQQYQEVRDNNGNVVSVIPASVAPLSYRDQNGLAALLATKLADYYGASLNPATVHDAQGFIGALSTGFGEPEEDIPNGFDEYFGRRHY